MLPTRQSRNQARLLRLIGIAFLVLLASLGCANKKRGLAGIGGGALPPGQLPDACSIPKAGCPCDEEGEEVPCGSVVSEGDGVVTCAKGTRVCTDKVWGECSDTHLEEQTVSRSVMQLNPLTLGGQADCPTGASYDCDPYCNYQNDTPDDTIDAGPNFETDGGLTLRQTGTGASACVSVAVSVRSPTTSPDFTVTALSPFRTDQTNNQVNLQVTATPSTCIMAPFETTWTIDKFDRAAIAGTASNTGVLTLTNGIAGPIKVTAYAAGLSASLTLKVRVNVVEVPGAESTPSTSLANWRVNRKVQTTADMNRFGANCLPNPATGSLPTADTCRNSPLVGTTASSVSYLYPYPGTWFPLGLIAPVVQYTYPSATNNDRAVKLSLRYPKNKTLANIGAGGATAAAVYFNYSLIVRETNNHVQYEPTVLAAAQPLDPQVQIPQLAWKAFEQTVRSFGDAGDAGGYDADLRVQRLVGTTLENEYVWPTPIHFAGGQLKGTVYYNSYNSLAGGSTNTNVVGAVLKINPGDIASTPTSAVPGAQGKCTICHSVSADGSTLTFASGDGNGSGCGGAVYMSAGSTYRENMCSFNMPAATLRRTHPGNTGDPYKFLWGAAYADGSFYLNNVWDNSRILNSEYPTGTGAAAPAGLYRTTDGALLASTGTPTAPVTPAFSPDGTKLAYNLGDTAAAGLSVNISEASACSVPVGPKVSEVASCGQANGLTISEVSSCPSVAISEVAACSAGPPVEISEVSSCPGLSISEIAACGNALNAVTISEVSPCREFDNSAGEAIEVRNDSGSAVNPAAWTVRAGTSTCTGGTACTMTISSTASLPSGGALTFTTGSATSCLGDAATGNVVTICSGTTVIATTNYALGGTCTSTNRRKAIQSCTGAWTSNNNSVANDAGNNNCAEAVELRNDTPVSVNIGNWKVRNNANATCFTVPGGTTLAAGAVWRGYVSTTLPCLGDAGDTLSLYDATSTTGTLRSMRVYAGNVCTTGVNGAKRGVLSCAGAWTNNNNGGGNDTSNDSCSNSEGVEIRNDAPTPYVIPSGYTIKSGNCAAASPTCVTFAANTTIAATSSQLFQTTAVAGGPTNCLADGSGTAVLCNGTTPVLSQAYAHSCAATGQRSQASCAGAWTDNVNGYGFDSTNNSCTSVALEAVEIRNDAAATVNIAGWVVKNSGGVTCATVPSGTVNVAAGDSYRLYTQSGTCFSDTGEQLTLYPSAASTTPVMSHTYTASACGTNAKRSVFSCAGVWTENIIASLAAQNDTSNDDCAVPATGRSEGIDIRNDTPASFNIGAGWVVKNGACSGGTQCGPALTAQTLAPGATLHVNTNNGGLSCLADGTSTVSLCNNTTTITSYAYNHTCGLAAGSTVQRAVRACAGTLSNVNGLTFDSGNDSCGASQLFEATEIRNDTRSTLPIAEWTVRRGTNCSGTLCATVPVGTPALSSGTSFRAYTTNGACLDDINGNVTICDRNGVPQQTRQYAHTACGNHGRMDCNGAWTDTVMGGTDDTGNNTCSTQAFEWIEIRNDTAGSVDISDWTARVGASTCMQVPPMTSLAQGGVYTGYSGGACLPDTSGTISLYDGGNNLVTSQAYTSTCSASTVKRGLLPCSGAWQNDTASTTTSNNSCAFSGQYATSGDELHVMSFNNTTKTFSGDTKVVDCGDAAQAGHEKCTRPSYPAFLPDNSGVLFQHQLKDSGFETGINSAYGALAQIWITKPSSKTPRALDNLNGWNGTNAVTVPTSPRHTSLPVPTGASASYVYDPEWHDGPADGTNTVWIYDQFVICQTAQNAVAAREDKLNYFPTVSPQEAGGAYWSIFTSRRLYGNVAISNPWQAQRSNNPTGRLGVFTGSGCTTNVMQAMSPGSGFIDAKKLWVSAIDKDWDGTSDPSHPPFYLPGQELQAGNSHGYWVAAACAEADAVCETNDDCCGGTGASPTMQCLTTVTAGTATKKCHAINMCSEANEACTTSDDCCGGLECPPGGGLCLNVGGTSYEKASYTREYKASCPTGTRVKWGRFEWQGTFPAGTEVDFYVQTKAAAADPYLPASGMPATKAALAVAKTTTAAGAWAGAVVDAALAAATPPQPSLDYLLVTMTFVPNSGGTVAPTLRNWRMIYDCLPAE